MSVPTCFFGRASVMRLCVVVLALLGSFIFSVRPVQAQTAGWTLMRTYSLPRQQYAMVYDSARNVSVMFGGRVLAGTTLINSSETWEWDGTHWIFRTDAGPSPRFSHAMAYDTARGVTVLFGGTTLNSGIGETWEWDGTSWRQRLVSGPSPRFVHSMCYDSARGVTVLFGGSSGSARNDETWEWDGIAWTQRTAAGPSPRNSHAMAYDPVRGVSVLFGGFVNGGSNLRSDETWEWNGTTWTQRAVTGPSARIDHSMTYDTVRHTILLHGGSLQSGSSNETWEWDGNGWTLRSSVGLVRYSHSLVFDTARGVATFFGGYTNGIDDRTYEWNGTVWSQRTNLAPSARIGHSMVYDSARNVAVMFGGYTNGYNGETWEWDGTFWNRRATTGPTARTAPRMAYDSARHVTVLFGGLTSTGSSAETWEWDGTTWTQRNISGPSARSYHCMTYDSSRGVTVLTGGVGATDTWEYDGNAWVLRDAAGIGAYIGPYQAMAYDPVRRVTVRFVSPTTSALEWNGTAWTLHSGGVAPSNRLHPSMTYDPIRGNVLMFGASGPADTSTWAWNGSAWGQLPVAAGPSSRYDLGMVYDSARGVSVIFGGSLTGTSTVSKETWTLRSPCMAPTVSVYPRPVSTCRGGDAMFTLTTGGDYPPTFQWRKNGVPIDASLNPTAAASTLVLSNVRTADVADYDCIATNTCGSVTSNIAHLSVCNANFNCDRVVDFFDYLDFVAAFAEGSMAADYNDDGMLDLFDYLDFVDAFNAGC